MKSYAFILYLMLLLLSTNSYSAEPQQFKGIVALHNSVRMQYQQTPLTWSDSLAQYAQEWVNNLATTQNCEMIHRPNEGNSKFRQIYGENLFWASPVKLFNNKTKKQSVTSQDIVKAWAEEANYYDYQTNRCQPGEDCGHFTQMVWHESRQVGCAMAVCPDQSQIWACNYYPRGNFIGEWPY